MMFVCILLDIKDFLFAVQPSVRPSVGIVQLCSFAGDASKLGPPFKRNAPALVIGKVPMKTVEMEQGSNINEFFQEVRGELMPAAVEHESTPHKFWLVLYLATRQLIG
ncbi:hypothetical protein SDC9_200796 [bioreactor metagenome]|uniref:Uncharacterized protein n=1 Tax=bioreactor metagenome TaxID=1076179 RepID=A0A645IQG7_9ZZZZ